MRHQLLLALIAFLMIAGNLAAQVVLDPDDLKAYLLPLHTEDPIPGAHGSLWSVDVWAVNEASEPVTISFGNPNCQFLCPTLVSLAPSYPERIEQGSSLIGALFYVPVESAADVHLKAHLRDESRLKWTFGTELPIPAVSEFSVTQVLLNIPADSRFRNLLRIYAIAGEDVLATVRVFDLGARLLAEVNVVLQGIDRQGEFPRVPAFANLDLSSLLSSLETPDGRYWLKVDSEVPVWSFVSVTNNETQQVTLVTPH